MSLEKLARLDLNLLVFLHVLLKENSVTKASKKLNLSQSAVSKSLGRLRELFDDKLFVRSSHGLIATPRAMAIKSELEYLLRDIEVLLSPKEFIPQKSERKFLMALVDSVYPLLLPYFINNVISQAPNVTLEASPLDKHTFNQLQNREIDFVITGKDLSKEDAALTLTPPKGVIYQELFQDKQCCIVNAKHPVLRQKWNLETYLKQRHVQVKCSGNEHWLLDFKLADIGLERDIAMYVPDFNCAASVCEHTNLIFTVPSRFGKHISSLFGLKILPLPFNLPHLSYNLFWQEHMENDLGHKWLRELIINQCKVLP
ncbi:MAG: LysR family transcriptional regulator [Alteromonadaceae bacterium]|nr:LysR family transcriptional regulator [Alteromonadaceae bacterium]